MIKFLLGTLLGSFIGVTFMCLCSIVDDIDEFADMAQDDLVIDDEDEMETESEYDRDRTY